MPKHTKFTIDPCTGQVQKQIVQATPTIHVSSPLTSLPTTRGRGRGRGQSVNSQRGSRSDVRPSRVSSDRRDGMEGVEKQRGVIGDVNLAENQFSADLFKCLMENGDGNVVVSPFSIFVALAMTLMGAREQTFTEMVDGLRLKESFKLCGEDFQQWKQEALQPYLKSIKQLMSDQNDTLSVANGIFVEKTMPVRADFIQVLNELFDAAPESSNFKQDCQGEVAKINKWVEDKTGNLIKNLLSPPCITNLTRMVLVNAIYFLGHWQTKFQQTNQFQKSAFRHVGDPHGENTNVVMMRITATRFPYSEDHDYKWVQLPYKNEDYCMTFVIPKNHIDLNEDTEKEFDNWICEQLKDMRNLKLSHKVDMNRVCIPKFKIEYTNENLGDVLQSNPFNIKLAFRKGHADFTGMVDREVDELSISKVVHKSFVEVDENGTKAAAATAVVMRGRGGGRSVKKEKEFDADRPFVFILHHLPSSTILFTGKINKL